MMIDVSNVSLKTTILGESISFPVCIAPSGMHMLAHPDGEMATAKGKVLVHMQIYFDHTNCETRNAGTVVCRARLLIM